MILDTVVFQHLVVCQNALLQVDHFGIIFEEVVANEEAAVQVNDLGYMQFAVRWLVQSPSCLDKLLLYMKHFVGQQITRHDMKKVFPLYHTMSVS